MNFEMDDNGFYHMVLNMESWQTIHRLSGNITDKKSGLPVENSRVTWATSHFWYIGDTLGYIVKTGLTGDLEYVKYDTSYVTWFNGYEVPVINPARYSNADGEVKPGINKIQISDPVIRELMTVDQVADYLQLKKKTIQNLTSNGKIPYCHIGGTVRYRKLEIDRVLDSKKR